VIAPFARDADPVKAANAWLKLYRRGKIDIYSKEILNRVPLVIDWRPPMITSKQSLAVKYGVAPKGGLGDATWLGDIELIAEALAKADTAAAARALIELAAVGLDKREYEREMAPHLVRGVGEKWAAKLQSDEARAVVVAAASGELKTSKAQAIAIQGAGLRCLGAFADPQFRTTIEPRLGHIDVMIRFHAAEALGRMRDEQAAMALINALETEATELVLPAIVEALRSTFAEHLPKLNDSDSSGDEPEMEEPAKPVTPPRSTRLAARAAIGALSRSTWRADMALLRFLDDFRTKDTIPALIGILEQYRDNPDQVQSGKLSTLVRHRAHELLVSMTGAVFPATQPDKWRSMWDSEQDKFEVKGRHTHSGQAHTVASGFAGIPVEGSRVLFILDLSRSMTFQMGKQQVQRSRKGRKDPAPSTRMDYARRELATAIDAMSENSSFNMITFDGDNKARQWNKSMTPATERNREKFKKFISGLKPDGGTNLWSALELALKTKSLVYGDQYETNVDEIFILSDGAPSVGEVLDPIEILRLVKESNRFAKMRINTVFISSDSEEERRQPAEWMTIKPEVLMRRLAEQNGGKCVIL